MTNRCSHNWTFISFRGCHFAFGYRDAAVGEYIEQFQFYESPALNTITILSDPNHHGKINADTQI